MIYCWYIFNIFVDNEDGGGMAIEGLDVENFGFPNAHSQSPYSNFQNEWRHEFYIYYYAKNFMNIQTLTCYIFILSNYLSVVVDICIIYYG